MFLPSTFASGKRYYFKRKHFHKLHCLKIINCRYKLHVFQYLKGNAHIKMHRLPRHCLILPPFAKRSQQPRLTFKLFLVVQIHKNVLNKMCSHDKTAEKDNKSQFWESRLTVKPGWERFLSFYCSSRWSPFSLPTATKDLTVI